ncbi:ATP-binding cassette domain-containing protein [Aeromicrobium phragmitis]|uniref:ATP-binding cassette domain-containing protein n=1 Tax=Aeromicrobium phragmitis TaxID=2478914 RepID=A0A3L8PN16_9ACTN|nr:AAA family ATPase [Aeromicrobium phragmitis]RLV56806.1 ATP-binding cassette domain-containing protein [Aeromicrobium phragmitis]
MAFEEWPVVRVTCGEPWPADWSARIPAVRHLLAHGLELGPGVTFLVGENGSGKSTLVEAIAAAYGLSPEGGSTQGHHQTHRSESALSDSLTLHRGIGAPRWGFFLRAETMHGWYTYQADEARGENFHAMSHGESFLEVVRQRFTSPGFYVLDEPEAALSFSSTLALLGAFHDLVDEGAQILCATHSPILASLPAATLLETGPWGLRETRWKDLELVQHWQEYLARPERYLRHILE